MAVMLRPAIATPPARPTVPPMWRRLANLSIVGFASGLPFQVPNDLIAAMLKDHGMSMAAIGATSLLSLPYTLKFLWAPLLDRAIPNIGRRRGWLVATQALLAVTIATIGWFDPRAGALGLGVTLVAIAVLSATQDIVADAYRTEACTAAERGPGASAFVIGYRLALVFAGWGGLLLSTPLGWGVVFALLGGVMALLAVISWFRTEPVPGPVAGLADLVVMPARVLWQRFGWMLIAVIIFAASIRAADALAGRLILPFLQGEMSNAMVGNIRGVVGLLATPVGSVLGAWLTLRLGLRRTMVLAVVLGGASNVAYAAIAHVASVHQLEWWRAAVAMSIEQLCGGILGTAMVAWFMSLCDPRCTAGQYALLTALTTLPGVLLGSRTGVWQEAVGWPWFFIISALAAVPAILLLPWALRGTAGPVDSAAALLPESKISAP